MENLVRWAADGTLVAILLISIPVVIVSIRHRFWQTTPVIIMAALTSLAIAKLASLAYQPDVARPFIELGVNPGAAYIDNPGFPSDHALLATVAVAAVWFVAKKRRLAALLALMLAIMCIGRVLALVHTPLDVIAGVIAGLCGAIWYRKIDKTS